MADLDPTRGVFRWSWIRARQHLFGVVVTFLGIPVLTGVLGGVIAVPSNPDMGDRLAQGFLAALIILVVLAGVAFLYAVIRAPLEQRNHLRRRVTELGLPMEDRDAVAREGGALARAMSEYLAEAMRTEPLTAPTLIPPDVDMEEAWRANARLQMDHDQKTLAGFFQRFLDRTASVCQAMESLGVLSDDDKRSLRRWMSSIHDLNHVPVLIAEKARSLGWREH